MQTVENPYITNGFVYTVHNQRTQTLFARQYATRPAAMAVVRAIQGAIPEIGALEIVSQYTGNPDNVVMMGDEKKPLDGDKVEQLSIRLFGGWTLHNAGEAYNALSKGYTYPIDEFRAEAGLS